jgi:hypothetical protein
MENKFTPLHCATIVFHAFPNASEVIPVVLTCVSIVIYIVTCIHNARQRLGKHIPAQAYACNRRASILRQRISKHASLTTETVVSDFIHRPDFNNYKKKKKHDVYY